MQVLLYCVFWSIEFLIISFSALVGRDDLRVDVVMRKVSFYDDSLPIDIILVMQIFCAVHLLNSEGDFEFKVGVG